MNTQELISEVTSLPVEERALIADTLLRTLNQPEPEVDQKWLQVARRRLNEIRSGKVKPVPGDEVFQKIWSKLGQ